MVKSRFLFKKVKHSIFKGKKRKKKIGSKEKMQNEGRPRFLKHHTSSVKGVSFSPKDRYLFTSGGSDGKINIYNAHQSSFHNLIISYQLAQSN